MTALKRLRTEPVRPLYVLYGGEYGLIRRFITVLQEQVEEETGTAVELQRFDFEEDGPDPALMACQSVGLFAARSVVWLRNCSALTSSAKVRHDTASLEEYVEHPYEGHTLVLSVSADKLDERKRLVKAAKRQVVVPCTTPSDGPALDWLRSVTQELDMRVEDGALSELWRRTPSLTAAETELQKLACYAPNRAITVEDVREVVTPPLEDNVFDWIDAVVSGDAAKAFRILDDVIRAGNDPLGLLALIARQFRLMWYARVLGARSVPTAKIAGRVGAHPYAIQVAARQSKRLPVERLEDLLTVVADAEFAIKSGKRDVRHALDWVVVRCAGVVGTVHGHSKR
jgi:DNA polymerase-3 subunit delta